MYRVIGDAAMVLHFGFLVYVALGGFLAWRWPRAIWPHLFAVAWAILIVARPLMMCPLTHVEEWARRRAGRTDLSGGFIDTYIEGVVYPEEYTPLARLALALLVLTAWTGAAVIRHRRRSHLVG